MCPKIGKNEQFWTWYHWTIISKTKLNSTLFEIFLSLHFGAMPQKHFQKTMNLVFETIKLWFLLGFFSWNLISPKKISRNNFNWQREMLDPVSTEDCCCCPPRLLAVPGGCPGGGRTCSSIILSSWKSLEDIWGWWSTP